MELRSRAKRQQQEKSRQSVAAEANAELDVLPGEIMSMLAARFLGQEDVAAASMTCQAWARVLRAGITSATLVVGDGNGPGPAFTLKAMGKHTSVSDLQLLLNSRSDYSHIQDTFGSLKQLPLLKRLQLQFLMSNTPKKGIWPVFFSDSLDAQQIDSINVQSPAMPTITLVSLLGNLGAAWGKGRWPSAAGSTLTPRHLELRLGQPAPGSQLPVFANPSWLLAGGGSSLRKSALDGEQLQQLSDVPSLASLRCEVSSTVLPSKLGLLGNLTNLTELVLYGTSALSTYQVQQLPQLRSLRKLGFTIKATTPSLGPLENLELDFVPELDLGVVCDVNGKALEPLLARPPAGLRGLTISGLCLQQSFVEQLAGLTNLTLLQLVNTVDGSNFFDLTSWRQLSGLKQLTLQVSRPMELMQLKFAPPPPPPKPERVLMGACQSVGKRRKSAAQQQIEQHLQQQQQHQQQREEDRVRWGDISALASAWPQLQALKLSGLSPYAVGRTSWEALCTLTALTSLALQFTPSTTTQHILTLGHPGVRHVPGEACAEPGRLGEVLPVLRLEQLPASVQELQLANCYVGVPATGCLCAGDALRTVSLSNCYLGSIEKGASSPAGYPIIIQDTPLATASTQPSDISQAHPLLLLLQHMPQLQMLELINLPWLTEALLSAAAAQVQLRALSNLSVIGIGNQHLTHGALLGLTSLRKLRELRWHVGSVLELMPDVNALAQLQGLMTVHLPHWLHTQMERWGAYAVLDSMPLCDVNVELP